MIGLADVDRYKICIEVCVWPGLRPLVVGVAISLTVSVNGPLQFFPLWMRQTRWTWSNHYFRTHHIRHERWFIIQNRLDPKRHMSCAADILSSREVGFLIKETTDSVFINTCQVANGEWLTLAGGWFSKVLALIGWAQFWQKIFPKVRKIKKNLIRF